MNGFLLDTNIPSEFRRDRPEPRVVRWLRSVDENTIYLSVITLGEIRKGCELLEPGKRRAWFAGRILPVNSAVAERWGKLEAKRQRLGIPLNTADGQIAATALVHGLTLVTHNVSDFRELGISLFDPWES